MEQVFVTALTGFINQRIGSVTRKQRLLVPVQIARELESMGLVAIEKQPLTVRMSAVSDPPDAGREAPSASLQAGHPSPTDTSPSRKRGKKKRAGESSR